MKYIICVFSATLALGVGLSLAPSFIIENRWIGIGATVGIALLIRLRWKDANLEGPSPPERSLWIGMTGTSIVLGFLSSALWRIGPAMELHTPAGHQVGTDVWSLVLGLLLAMYIVRTPNPNADERDAWIAAKGSRTSYWWLSALLVALILTLGYGFLATFSQAMVAHLIIVALLVAWLANQLIQLWWYSKDHREQLQSAHSDKT